MNNRSEVTPSCPQQYAEDQAETPAALRAALAEGDAKTAERLAHTLKGVSATLGIKPASEAGAVVEDRIRHGRLEGIEDDLVVLEQATGAVIAGIRAALAPAAPVAASELADMAVVIPLLGRLEELLVNSDGAALDCVLEAQEVLARVLSAEEFAGLTREVQNFAFDAALVQLRAIAARIGRRPPAATAPPWARPCIGWKPCWPTATARRSIARLRRRSCWSAHWARRRPAHCSARSAISTSTPP